VNYYLRSDEFPYPLLSYSYRDSLLDSTYTRFTPEGGYYISGNIEKGHPVGEWTVYSEFDTVTTNYGSLGDKEPEYRAFQKDKGRLYYGEPVIIDAGFHLPLFYGGYEDLFVFVWRNLEYPKKAIRNGSIGEVSIGFTISDMGFVKDLEVLKSATPTLDEEALRVMELVPRWMPAIVNGTPVEFDLAYPFTFTIY
jgi:TonB family protein